MPKDLESMELSNPAAQRVRPDEMAVEALTGRRQVIQGGLGAVLAGVFGGSLAGCASLADSMGMGRRLGFKGIAASRADALRVPEGYVTQVLAPWGEPIGVAGAGMPLFKDDASNTAAEQALQMGQHHDGIHYVPLPDFDDRNGNRHGLLVMNHEYVDDGLLHVGGLAPWTAEKVAKSQASHGISVIEIKLEGNEWKLVRPSRWARRITANTPFRIGGPGAGHALMKTAADPQARVILGTLNNCASGMTPWGTYLSGEENFRFYFAGGKNLSDDQKRWGMTENAFFRWPEHDSRFDATKNPNEFNRFGWVVEVDPMDPFAMPVKRTALGRAAHEGAWVGVTQDQRAVVYSGEDARFEYIYKFVSRDPIRPAGNGLTKAQANRDLLDHGTLYVARFDADGTGVWLPLVHGQGPLTAANGFTDQGDVVIRTRQAADLLGATRMDRPEWLAIDQAKREVFCTLTNNSLRGRAPNPGPDAANPRANNVMGQIIRWTETGDFDSTHMRWSHLVLAGDPANTRPEAKGNIRGDIFACPDGLMLDNRGVLWIQTDAAAAEMNKGEFERIGNNQMLACDLESGEIRRFLTGPVNAEITGATLTPDGQTLFINVQHPGETPSERSNPARPAQYSTWPGLGARPRSATVAIRKVEGGRIGT